MRLLCPDEIVQTVYDIDMDALWRKGIRGLLMDLDNTLVRWDSDEVPEELTAWIERAKQAGLVMCLVSNGMHKRVRRCAQLMGIPFVSKAIKPRRRPFRHALKMLDLRPEQASMIGDQLFTDILGGNRMGIYTILIDPLSPTELRSTRLVRTVERRVLGRLVRKGMLSSEAILRRHGGIVK